MMVLALLFAGATAFGQAPPRPVRHDIAQAGREFLVLRHQQVRFAELDANPDGVAELRAALGRGTATLLFGSKESELNNATALREYLEAGRERPPERRKP